ncbi:MAG: hypothetical protein KGD57_00985 [Candidatus Lokiarchaeota archaeon]|nr:hypothetical protein [Candidatus Lokiarchaeota archaeon]
MNNISKHNLFLIRKEKLKKEILSAKRILQDKREPLDVADDFISNTFKLIEESTKKRNPNLSDQEIFLKIKSNISLFTKIKSEKKGNKIWQN